MRQAWILAGHVDGAAPTLPLDARIAGMPVVLRHACEARAAGARDIAVIWIGGDEPPRDVIDEAGADDRLAGVELTLVTEPPETDRDVLIVRADRIYHRDHPKRAADAAADRPLRKIAGDANDAVFAASPELARQLVEAAARPGGIDALVAERAAAGEVTEVDPPYLDFCTAAPDRAGRRRAEKKLVGSLRKKADGYMARVLNRRISLPISRLLARTSIRPNHVTVLCFLSALSGAFVIAQGGYRNGVIGMLLVEWGSICDGIDGELARLKFRFSRLGQWMDTVTDDISNVCINIGVALSLDAAGVDWAIPVVLVGLAAFALTQSSQYYLIATIYKSGDLAAIPWAFQSTDFLESRPTGLWPRIKAGVPKLLKRDSFVTLFVILAFAGFLEGILLIFTGGAVAFLFSYTVQYLRVRPTLRAG
jgi:phosphatidylglycerophosphate synthase